MSLVTNIIIKTLFDENAAIDAINRWADERYDTRGFTECSTEECAGSKYLEVKLFLGSYNYLDVKEFIDIVKKAPWEDIGTVQVFVQEQDDNLMRDVLRC